MARAELVFEPCLQQPGRLFNLVQGDETDGNWQLLRLATCEFQKQSDVMIVRGAQCRDIACPQFANVGQTATAPGKRFTAKPLDQEVGRETCVARKP